MQDGVRDCPGAGDETPCLVELACDDGDVVQGALCDGLHSCSDGSDELECPFQCPFGGPTLDAAQVCDGTEDCAGGEDEGEFVCAAPQFQCSVGPGSTSIPPELVCDGNADCPEGQDELDANCQYTCASGSGVVTGVDVCDGMAQCADGSDEAGCPFACGDGTFVSASQVCDQSIDCLTGADEVGCQLQCGSGELVGPEVLCDGASQCGDGGDESGCPFGCGDGGSVPAAQVCDGTAQCTDGSDEIGCGACTASGACVFEESLVVDDVGRVVRIEEVVFGQARVVEIDYDLRGRMVEVRQDGQLLEASTYDAASNRVQIQRGPALGGALVDVEVDAQDRLLSWTEDAQTTSYVHDAAGDRTAKIAPNSDTWTYDYDAFGALRGLTLPDGSVVNYDVDPRGRRVGRRVNGVRTHAWLYGSQRSPIAEYDGDGTLVSRFVYASRGHVPDAVVKGGQVYRVISDHLGSVRLVVHAQSQQVLQRLEYDPWGRVTMDTNPGFQPFGYAGGLYDPLTGLVRFGARDYDPEVGRWTTKDPIGFDGGTNWYEYAGSQPWTSIDPSGLEDPDKGGWADAAAGFGDWWSARGRDMAAFAVGGWARLAAVYFLDPGSPTQWIRAALDIDDVVDSESSAYGWGEYCADMASPAGGGGPIAPSAARTSSSLTPSP